MLVQRKSFHCFQEIADRKSTGLSIAAFFLLSFCSY
jgi:hypothetical protein